MDVVVGAENDVADASVESLAKAPSSRSGYAFRHSADKETTTSVQLALDAGRDGGCGQEMVHLGKEIEKGEGAEEGRRGEGISSVSAGCRERLRG